MTHHEVTFVDYHPSQRKAIFSRWDGKWYRSQIYRNISIASRHRMVAALRSHETRWDSANWREQTIVQPEA